MRGHFVYIVMCRDGTLYTGYTTDPDRRLKDHNAGKGSKYTRSRRPVSLVHLERLKSKSAALGRELEIKKFGRKEKLLLTAS